MSRAALLALLLVGCGDSGYWKLDMPGFKPSAVQIHYLDTSAALEEACGFKSRACTLRFGDLRMAVVYLGPDADNCTLRHELRHAAGWNHDQRAVYRDDCGER